MKNDGINKIYNLYLELGGVGEIVEVGANHSTTCMSIPFILNDHKVTLIEAQPELALEMQNTFKSRLNVTVLNLAISNKNGKIFLYRRRVEDPSAFIEAVDVSPMIKSDKYIKKDSDRIEINSSTMNNIDSGNIDVLLVDAEGSEYFVLEYLKSRPKIITLEMVGPNGYEAYQKDKIDNWLKNNNYRFYDQIEEDFIFIKN